MQGFLLRADHSSSNPSFIYRVRKNEGAAITMVQTAMLGRTCMYGYVTSEWVKGDGGWRL